MAMVGWDRTYRRPGDGRPVAAWDLLGSASDWAVRTVDAVIASLTDSARYVVDDCTECVDTGLYGIEETPDELTGLLRVRGTVPECLRADGSWVPYTGGAPEMRLLDRELAVDLAEAILSGASLILRPVMPRAWLPPSSCQPVVAAVDMVNPARPPTDDQAAPDSGAANEGDWLTYAIVDELDTGAVLDVFRLAPGPELQRLTADGWTDDAQLLADLKGVTPPPVVELTDPTVRDGVLAQVKASLAQDAAGGNADDGGDTGDGQAAAGVTAAVEDNLPKQQKCKYCKSPATKRILHSEGMAYIAVCDDHLAQGRHNAERSTPDGTADPSNIVWVHAMDGTPIAAAVSPDPRAEKLRRYWSIGGKGGAKIRWGTPGDWRRCVRYLRKYMGSRANGYCQNMHKRNTGMWTGNRANRVGSIPELTLLSSIRTGTWVREDGKATDMLSDGIYTEQIQDALVASLVAGAFPVAPPDEWFADPVLSAVTPITVDDNGRVYGHLADWSTAHIGLPSPTHAPKSRSNYAFFKTGVLRTAGGADVNVGQLTLVGGHAPLSADAASAVKHYDDTASAVADVAVGEDRYGIWVAGSMRPEVTPEQLRAFRASALSGDWRPIKGSLELVAACAVNVPGFPIARARVASGQVLAMVAAGARTLYTKQISLLSDAAVTERIAALEQLLADAGIAPAPAVVDTAPVADVSTLTPLDPGEEPPPEQVKEQTRDRVRGFKRARLRERVHGTPIAASARTR